MTSRHTDGSRAAKNVGVYIAQIVRRALVNPDLCKKRLDKEIAIGAGTAGGLGGRRDGQDAVDSTD